MKLIQSKIHVYSSECASTYNRVFRVNFQDFNEGCVCFSVVVLTEVDKGPGKTIIAPRNSTDKIRTWQKNDSFVKLCSFCSIIQAILKLWKACNTWPELYGQVTMHLTLAKYSLIWLPCPQKSKTISKISIKVSTLMNLKANNSRECALLFCLLPTDGNVYISIGQ